MVFGYLRFIKQQQEVSESTAQTTAGTQSNPTSPTVRLIATGDFIAHDAVNNDAQDGGKYDYYPFVSDMQKVFDKSDIKFCNQATLAGGEQFGVSGYPIFNAPIEWIDMMDKLGCNLINLASNHSTDRGQDVINQNIANWASKQSILASAGMSSSAENQQKVSYFEMGGVKFAFLTYTTYLNGNPANSYSINKYSRDFAQSQLAEAKQNADFIVVSMRWGTEYSKGINQYQKTEAKFLAQSGANLILGHGTHVLQPVDKIANSDGSETVVWYSLGNFVHSQVEDETRFNCVAVVEINKQTKKVSNNSCLPIFMYYKWTKEAKLKQDLLARSGFRTVTVENNSDLITEVVLDTDEATQMARIKEALGTLTATPILPLKDYGL